MISPIYITSITVAIYGMATVTGLAGLVFRKHNWRLAGSLLAVGAFLCQTAFLTSGYHKTLFSGPSMGAYLQMLAWFALLCGLLAWWRFHHDMIMLFAAPLAFILFLMSVPSLNSSLHLPVYLSGSFYLLHIGSLFLGLGMLALAFVCGIVFLILEKRIKTRKKINGFWRDMPALEILDKINFVCSIGAFPLYTTGVIAGFFWANPIFGASLNADPKKIISLIVWLFLAMLFHNRLAKNWRGRKPAIFVVIIFLLSLFSIFIVNFFIPTHHSFTGK